VLTEFASWRWIFYINLPVGIFAILWAWRVLEPEGRRARQMFADRAFHHGQPPTARHRRPGLGFGVLLNRFADRHGRPSSQI